MDRLLTATLAFLVAASPASGAELPRKASLGVRMASAPQGMTGVQIAEVIGGTAKAIGLRAGDVVLRAGGRGVGSAGELAAYAGTLHSGDRVEIDASRAGKPIHLRGKALPGPPPVREQPDRVVPPQPEPG